MKQKPEDLRRQSSKPKAQIVYTAIKEFPWWIAGIIFAITTVIFFWSQLTGGSFFWEDFLEQVYPIQTFAARAFAKGEIPFWNPYAFNGMPFFADLQVGFFYPFNRLLSLFLDAKGNLPVSALQFVIILHFFIAQLSMFKLTRYFKISSFGAVLASISYAFSFIMVCHVIHPMMVEHLAWFPLIIYFFIRGLNESSLKMSIYSGLIFGMSMLAGHPQTMLYEVLFLGLMFLWYFFAEVRKKEKKGKDFIKYISAGIIPFVLAVGIFCVQYLPSSELATQSQRSESSFEKAAEGSLAFKQIYTSVIPKLFGFHDATGDNSVPYHLDKAPYYYYWDTAFYFGVAALLLGIVGAVVGYKKREGAFFIAIAVFGFLFALGSNFFVFNIFYNLPFFGLLRIPARIMFFGVTALSILAGFGFDALWQTRKAPTITLKYSIAFAVPLLIAVLTASGSLLSIIETPAQLQSPIQSFGTTALMLIIVIILISLLVHRNILKPEIGGGMLILVVFIDLFVAGATFNQSPNDPAKSYTMAFDANPELRKLLTATPPNDIYRISMRHYKPSYMAMLRNQGLVDKIMLVEGYNQLVLQRAKSYAPDVKTIHNLLNVKYEIALDTPNRAFKFVERKDFFPHAWMVHRAQYANATEVESRMKYGNINFLSEVVLEDEATMKLPAFPVDSSSDKVECLSYKDNSMKYKVSSANPGIVVFSEIWYPAWKAYLDGREVKVLKANYSLRGVYVPEGEHLIEMRYESASFKKGLYISILSLLAACVGLIVLKIRKTE